MEVISRAAHSNIVDAEGKPLGARGDGQAFRYKSPDRVPG
jgi:hypothetical protein